MTTNKAFGRAGKVSVLLAIAGAAMLDTGCGWPLGPRPRRAPISECRMDIRLTSDPAMRPVRVFTGDLLMDPFGFQVTGCGNPSSPDAREKWERGVQQVLTDLCAPTSAASPEARMRWCSAGAWCKVPGSSTCSDHTPIDDGICRPPPSTMPIPDCAVMPPPPGPRIEVTPNAVSFAATLLGNVQSEPVVVRNSGTGMLRLDVARIVTDATSGGSFDVSSTCATPTFLSGTMSCTLTVRFTPTGMAGPKQGRLEIPYNDGMDRVLPVAVSGTALAPTLEVPGCTDPPSTPGGLRRLCFGVLGTRRSFTLRSSSGVIPVTLGLPPPVPGMASYTLVEPASPSFDVSMVPTTVTVSVTPFRPGTLVINRRDGGSPVSLELTNSCTVPSGCS